MSQQGKPAHSLLQGDRLQKELAAQRARAIARAYVENKGVMHDSVVERVLNKGAVTKEEAQELSLRTGEQRDNTLELMRGRTAQAKSKEQELKAKLLRQQEDFRDKRQEKEAEGEAPLPAGWKEVTDPTSGDVYYWHMHTNQTRWERPTASEAEGSAAAPAVATATSTSTSTSTPAAVQEPASSLPAGWKEVKHPATGQVYFIHEDGRKRWDRPTSVDDVSDIALRQKEHAQSAKAAAKAQAAQAKGLKRPRKEEVDPLDPTGGKGNWGDGIRNMGERMADSTASGSLWQQRPLPAPGSILRGGRK